MPMICTVWPGSSGGWAVDQAIATGADVIYLEDLATLQARGHRRGNARLSGQVRGLVVAAIRHLAAKAGIAVAARGTSKYCPRCGTGTGVLKAGLSKDFSPCAGVAYGSRPHRGGTASGGTRILFPPWPQRRTSMVTAKADS
jgi:hypothetical protein